MTGSISDYKHINSTGTTQLRTGKGLLRRISVNDIGTGMNIKVYDDTSGTSNLIADINPTVTGMLNFNVRYNNGLKIVITGTAGSITVMEEGV